MSTFLALLVRYVTVTILAADFGTHGHTFAIEEENLIDYLERKVEEMSSHEIEDTTNKLKSHYKKTFCNPEPVKNIQNATESSIHYFDPTIIAKQKILDTNGKVIVEKGATYNPLQYFSLTENLLFFDGNDLSHLQWAKSIDRKTKWILTAGNPLELEEKEEHPVYFDQNGLLTQKLKITAVPALVSQEGLRLKIETIPAKGKA